VELQHLDPAQISQAGVEASTQCVERVIDERLSPRCISMLSECGGNAQLIALRRVKGPNQFAESLFGDTIGRSRIEIADAGGPGEFQQTEGFAFRGNLAGDVAPGFADADNPEAESDGGGHSGIVRRKKKAGTEVPTWIGGKLFL